MIYFTADLHIGHDKDFIWEERGFSSVEEHDKEILKRWNEVVKPEDIVYILGDLALGQNENEWDNIFYDLNGNIFFIQGNHDTNRRISIYQARYIMNYLGAASFWKYGKKSFYLSHYSTLVANKDDKKFLWNLSGHTHSKNKFEYGQYHVYNVAVDAHNCYPVSIEEIIKDIKNYNNIQI